MVNFIRTTCGKYIAVDTIAVLLDVDQGASPTPRNLEAHLKTPVSFTIETKRGQLLAVRTDMRTLMDLIGGPDEL